MRRKVPKEFKLPREFYRRPAETVAAELIGKRLVHRIRGKEFRARIVETEAYVGEHDLAAHSSKGRTARTEVMFGDAGYAYVYFIYGMYDMLNIVASTEGDAQAVLIRAAEPLDDWDVDLSGPGKLCRAMKITRAKDNGRDLTGDELYLLDDANDSPKIARSRRINVDYAKDWLHAELRFYDANSAAVTKHPKTLAGSPAFGKMRRGRRG
ncbi:MAG: DNA-3-methyladenine glycosylase [Anaerolineae bacterium]|nr:DNA-3-methyladenine glycosylase [Phycisphaerae bacterium]